MKKCRRKDVKAKKTTPDKRAFKSIDEFEKKYLPKAFQARTVRKPPDARAHGSNLAKESMEKVEEKLSKQITC